MLYIQSGAHEGLQGASNYDLCVGPLSAAGPYMANHKIPDTQHLVRRGGRLTTDPKVGVM